MESLSRKGRLISRGKRAALDCRKEGVVQLPWQRREIQLHRKRGAEKVPLREARLIRSLP